MYFFCVAVVLSATVSLHFSDKQVCIDLHSHRILYSSCQAESIQAWVTKHGGFIMFMRISMLNTL